MSSPSTRAEGSTSSRPIPNRTLPHPSRLSVAHRDQSGQLDVTQTSDVLALSRDVTKRAGTSKQAEKWAERIMEETVSAATFKKAVILFSLNQYREVIHERHLNGLCSYPRCSNAPKREFSSKRNFKISRAKQTIVERMGNHEDGFCSRSCDVKNGFVEDQLDRQSVWERRKVTLLEESELDAGARTKEVEGREARIEAVSGLGSTSRAVPATRPVQPLMRSSGAAAGTPVRPPNQDPAPSNPPLADAAQEIKSRPLALASTTLKDNPGEMTELLSGLTIHERRTPPTLPAPPSLDVPAKAVSPPLAVPTSRRDAGSLIATPAKLATTFLTATKQMGPIAQLAPDSDEEEEEGGGWADEWGVEDEEMKGLFEQAKMAQDMEGN